MAGGDECLCLHMIRPFASDDVEELLDVWHRASLVAHWFSSDRFFEEERAEIVSHWLPIAETSVYESEGRRGDLGPRRDLRVRSKGSRPNTTRHPSDIDGIGVDTDCRTRVSPAPHQLS